MSFTPVDEAMMQRALDLAALGLFTTQPNPRVGCVLTQGETVVGTGWHERAGEPHAEVHALREAGADAAGATAYVTLEPCAHHGRTPPCVEALIAARVGRVVVAARDPFLQVDGRGLAALRAAGVTVDTGLLEAPARDLNRGFFSRIERGRPWLRLKLAMSMDGRTALADGRSQWITSLDARRDNMRWRARSSVILTGIGTVLADDPRLTVRFDDDTAFVPPLRVVLDSSLRTPPDACVLNEAAPSLIVCAPEHVAGHPRVGASRIMSCPHHATGLGLAVVLAELAQRGANEVQVESGPRLSGAFVQAGLVDEILVYVNASFLGDDAKPLFELPVLRSLDQRSRWRFHEVQAVGEDVRLLLRPRDDG